MVLKANDRRNSCPCHDEFRGPRSDYVRQVALATTTTTTTSTKKVQWAITGPFRKDHQATYGQQAAGRVSLL
ncbi:hypothetical protein TNCV_1756001 [Trichonephila clavipes]|nr:hypothetical protein TNCV_1756001 [Trichonephila clavipes]